MKEKIKKKIDKREKEFQERVKKLNELSRKNPRPLIQWLADAEQIFEDEKDYLEVVNLVKRHKQKIFNKLLKDRKSFDDYKFITEEFKTNNVRNNSEFQKVYKRFYVLNRGGLGSKLIDRYFDLLQKKETNLKKILVELSEISREKSDYSVQLSFASKLIHTVDNNQPIYDSRVAEIFDIRLNYNIKDIKERIADRLVAYNLLKKKFNKTLKNRGIKLIIKDFKKRLKVDIGDVKMLDFMLWKLGGIIIEQKR